MRTRRPSANFHLRKSSIDGWHEPFALSCLLKLGAGMDVGMFVGGWEGSLIVDSCNVNQKALIHLRVARVMQIHTMVSLISSFLNRSQKNSRRFSPVCDKVGG
jgi:hypothetical protein